MREIPADSVIHIEREAGFDKVVLSYPTKLSARIGTTLILTTISLVALYFWLDAVGELFDDSVGFDQIMQLFFTTLVLGFMGLMAKVALRRRVPESVMVVGEGIIHDSGVDPYRKSELEKDQTRQNEQFMKARKRMSFSKAEVATLTRTDIPYKNRLYIESDSNRHDIGEALSVEERAWLYDYLTDKLALPESLNREAINLIDEIEIEESEKPLLEISDVHSGHRVDPLDFDDPVAQNADWQSIAPGSASFKTHTLVRGAGRAVFKSTRVARLFALIFPTIGVGVIGLAISQFLYNDQVSIAGPVFLFCVGSIFFVAGLFLVRTTFEPIVFSLRGGHFRKGWSNADVIPLADIVGIQLLAFASTGDSVYTGYEVNILLRCGTRAHVLCHGDADRLREDAMSLSQFLGRPLFDGIR